MKQKVWKHNSMKTCLDCKNSRQIDRYLLEIEIGTYVINILRNEVPLLPTTLLH
jgi:hypothetical protein